MPPNENSVKELQSSPIKIVIIGQSQFAADTVEILQQNGHKVVGIFTIPDKNNREDVLASKGFKDNIPVFKIPKWRAAGKVLEEVFQIYKSLEADLNVLPYCSQFIPMEIITYPKYQSICYHPSLLPKHRGASSINWTLISGDSKAGFTIFWADDGLDTGPILLQKSCNVEEDDTVDTLYKNFLYPEGVKALATAVDLVSRDKAPRIIQNEAQASYEPILKTAQFVDLSQGGRKIHDFIRGLDSVPGAKISIKLPGFEADQEVGLFDCTICDWELLDQQEIQLTGGGKLWVSEDGVILRGIDGVKVLVRRVKVSGRFRKACELLESSNKVKCELSAEDQRIKEQIQKIWFDILKMEVLDETDFFQSGAGSMDVVRLIAEVNDLLGYDLQNESLFLNPTFEEFVVHTIQKSNPTTKLSYEKHVLLANKLEIDLPTQLFINNEFHDSINKQTLNIINPHDESLICKVQSAGVEDIDKAVKAASKAFKTEWSLLSARDRSKLMFKLADLMEEHKEELATIESIDSGAVYTLALKTHVGMSIETWRYFAGCCDKIQGATIPISSNRPHKNFCYTKKEPLGVCGLITPWNYPLMMLSWKLAACLSAGNTVVLKPAQVCPLSALKLAELSVKAGFPKGVINILPGTGTIAGNALTLHPGVKKIGFTGSTPIGKTIMENCSSTLKKISLELGGKSPLVIFQDCDLDKAVKIGMQSVFFNKGENCISAGRIFVESSIHDEFVKRVVLETQRLRIGDPLDRSTEHGPQNHEAHLLKLLDFVKRGVAEGARLEVGGGRFGTLGFYFEPTILTNVTDEMFIAKEESFGPIMVISRFKNGDFEGVVRRANSTNYGLAAGVFTKDISKALRFADKIQAGTVFINTYNKTDVAAPFGGCKQSGFGKDLGLEALNEYLHQKTVTLEY